MFSITSSGNFPFFPPASWNSGNLLFILFLSSLKSKIYRKVSFQDLAPELALREQNDNYCLWGSKQRYTLSIAGHTCTWWMCLCHTDVSSPYTWHISLLLVALLTYPGHSRGFLSLIPCLGQENLGSVCPGLQRQTDAARQFCSALWLWASYEWKSH